MEPSLKTYIILLIILLYYFIYKKKAKNPHEIRPIYADEKGYTEEMVKKIIYSEYSKNLESLRNHVVGLKVLEAVIGNKGFILKLENNKWAAAYRMDNSILHKFGNENINSEILEIINSKEYGDASDFINENKPYVTEVNNIKAEVEKSYCKVIDDLSIGDNTFNFTFDDGHELDFHLCNDKNNKPAIRVFWEQW